MSIYVETCIRGTMDELWRVTQTPDLHVRWDLRFTGIEYLPRSDVTQPQRFRYTTRLGFGLAVRGEGETTGQGEGPNGERSSALKFWSDDAKSLIAEGAGYWRYVPTADGLRFCTSYDYRVRFGAFGKLIDRVVFRPLMGWATAWSFDRLRLWIEQGIDPGSSLRLSLIHAVARAGLAFAWLYQGIVPKLLHVNADELKLIREAGFPAGWAAPGIQILGWAEVAFGLAMLIFVRQRWQFLATLFLVLAATADVAINSPRFLLAAFNPATMNGLMVALSLVGFVASRDLPSARRCLRKPPREEP